MKKISIKSIISKLVLIMMCLLSFTANLINPVSIKSAPSGLCLKQVCAYEFPNIKQFIKSLFKKNDSKEVHSTEKVYVYLGGNPLGFTIKCSGVIVVAISNESAYELKAGDILTEIEGISVNSLDEITMLINTSTFAGQTLSVNFLRDGKEMQTTIKPIYDEKLKLFKLGLWIRDNSAGVGTLTYIRKDNLRFGALGHPVCDIDTGSVFPISTGNIYKCNIVGYKTGVKGNPGELRGLFLRNGSVLGKLEKNNKFGVYGTVNKKCLNVFDGDEVEVAGRNEVKSGKAQIRCTIDGTEPKFYDIEIVKTYFQATESNKSMFIRVTDKELLSTTGGIVQGMSGSPIIQNGKLVGAITHVFVSDPTKGYGIYADWMINN